MRRDAPAAKASKDGAYRPTDTQWQTLDVETVAEMPFRTILATDGKIAIDDSILKKPSALTDEDLVHALAQYLDFEPIEKQALLQEDSFSSRTSCLIELLEMKLLAQRLPSLPTAAH